MRHPKSSLDDIVTRPSPQPAILLHGRPPSQRYLRAITARIVVDDSSCTASRLTQGNEISIHRDTSPS